GGGGGGGMAIGSAVSGSTVLGGLYVDSAGNLNQTAGFSIDAVNNQVRLGVNAAVGGGFLGKNVVIGDGALRYLTSNSSGAASLVAIGRDAAANFTIGGLSNAVYIGAQAGGNAPNSTPGPGSAYEVGVGYQALRSRTTGLQSTAVGGQALLNST